MELASSTARRCSYFFRTKSILILWMLLMAVVFWTTYFHYKYDPKYYYLREMLGSSLYLSRGTASMLNISCCVVVLPMCRGLGYLLLSLAGEHSCSLIRCWINESKKIHIICAVTIVVASILHSISHVINAQNFSHHYNYHFKDVNVANFCGEDPLFTVLGTVPGVTGVAMVLVLCLLCSSSMSYVRETCYDAFWYTHRLFIVFLVLLVLHPISGVLKEQSNIDHHIPGCRMDNLTHTDSKTAHLERLHEYFDECVVQPKFIPQNTQTWKWVVSGLVVYVIDFTYRLIRRRSTSGVAAVNNSQASVLELTLETKTRFSFRPGQYVLLNCPKVSLLEWHPFTVTSCATADQAKFTLHLRTNGDWSLFDQSEQTSTFKVPYTATRLYIDGPFCSPSEGVLHHRVSICVAGGIGVTPFASFLNYIRVRTRNLDKLAVKRFHLLWLCREMQSFLCFTDLLTCIQNQMWEENRPDFIDIQLYLTRQYRQEQLQNILRACPGLVYKVQFGRPDWPCLFREWEELYRGKLHCSLLGNSSCLKWRKYDCTRQRHRIRIMMTYSLETFILTYQCYLRIKVPNMTFHGHTLHMLMVISIIHIQGR
ncbi:NADPH oxidase 4-like [Limulus polyphemus]|uniref:NADPH oxidase 4-like n=1 Tax=Limulus polyphemus TaxID=6850 RepID=A0ABM1SHT4_LIMPO|nr:NADPH oxidase 4-like [Limulus polyphemus]